VDDPIAGERIVESRQFPELLDHLSDRRSFPVRLRPGDQASEHAALTQPFDGEPTHGKWRERF